MRMTVRGAAGRLKIIGSHDMRGACTIAPFWQLRGRRPAELDLGLAKRRAATAEIRAHVPTTSC